MKKILSKVRKFKLSKFQIFTLAGVSLLVLGALIVAPTLYFRWSDTGTANASSLTSSQVWSKVAADKTPATNNEPRVTGFPVSISIPGPRPDLDMSNSIIPGYYDKATGAWTLTDDDAQFATISSKPNNISGNTFIYGHYRPNVFAYLHLITPGTIATITTNNGYQFSYKFVDSYAVQPTDTEVLSTSISPVLTIQTCSGTFMQNRSMYVFSYVSYKKV
jgi:hypothetical protein